MIARRLSTLRRPLDTERRASLTILVAARWFLIGTALVTVLYRPTGGNREVAALVLLIAGAALLNVLLQARLRGARTVTLALPVLAGVYDVAAITGAIAVVDGFKSDAFVLYYPALLAFSAVFPGRWSAAYAVATAIAYLVAALPTEDSFDRTYPGDQRVLALRLSAMAATVFVANLVVRIERQRRERAVAAEAARAREVRMLEERARAAERAAHEERRRLSREVHDGIAQEIYMLTLGLETAAALSAERAGEDGLSGRLETLVHLSKHTLLDTRNLLFDLEGVMAGQASLGALVRNQAQEFAAVSGIRVDVQVCGDEQPLSPATVGEVYRVVQEGVANVYKHAHARAACLRLTYGDRTLLLQIVDDGRGFDPALPRNRGRGIANMEERAGRLGGHLTISAAPEGGTILSVSIPIEEPRHADDPRATG